MQDKPDYAPPFHHFPHPKSHPSLLRRACKKDAIRQRKKRITSPLRGPKYTLARAGIILSRGGKMSRPRPGYLSLMHYTSLSVNYRNDSLLGTREREATQSERVAISLAGQRLFHRCQFRYLMCVLCVCVRVYVCVGRYECWWLYRGFSEGRRESICTSLGCSRFVFVGRSTEGGVPSRSVLLYGGN